MGGLKNLGNWQIFYRLTHSTFHMNPYILLPLVLKHNNFHDIKLNFHADIYDDVE